MTDRHGLGGNSPPPHEAFALEIEQLFSTVSGSVASPITTDEQEAGIDGLLDDVRRARKDADAQRKAEKRPHSDAAKQVDANWMPLIDRCEHAEMALKKALTPYRQAKQKAKDEAARKAREEAEAKQKAAQQALRNSDDLEERFAAEEQLKQADRLVKSANRSDREATGLRSHWVAEITDHRAALNYYLKREPDQFKDLIQGLASRDARGARAPVPGVTFIEKKEAV